MSTQSLTQSRFPSVRLLRALGLSGLLAGTLVVACDAGESGYDAPALPGTDAGTLPDGAPIPVTPGIDASPVEPEVDAGPCLTTFRYVPPAGKAPKSVAVTGEWNGFAQAGVPMTGPDASGAFTAKVQLAPGLVGYKLLLDGNYELDTSARLRKYVGGVENSAIRAVDCTVPSFALDAKTLTRTAPGQGRFAATLRFVRGQGGRDIDPSTLEAVLSRDGTDAQGKASFDGTNVSVEVSALQDGKYTLWVRGKDKGGRVAKPLRLIFWVEDKPFEWQDAMIYMIMLDRFKNGDPASDAPKIAGVDPRADFMGGDLDGVRAKIADGTLDKLGVRALWFSPFHENPIGAYMADDGVHKVTGYHGYWPTKARTVDARIGGEKALRAMVAEAHRHGIRILQDFVINHVHEEHEYFKKHPDWFRTGCQCGTGGCDWTSKRLECLFAKYLPDVNWSNAEAADQFADDAAWWIDTFDLDGLRVDAVKHVEDLAVMNVSTRIREEFEAAGNRVFLTGETAMGWSDCGLACNDEQYGTINRYMGPYQLDGQFDFVLYHAVPSRVFAYDERGMLHADYWTQASGWKYPKGSVMTPYIGSHDTSRFVSQSTYRGQPGYDRGRVDNKWTNIAGSPPDAEPYARHRLALAWLMAIPGAPLLYYGDEYGEFGGSDPNNRSVWRGDAVSGEELATLEFTRKLGTARKNLEPLRRGEYRPVYANEDDLVFARQSGSNVVLVALTRRPGGASLTVDLPPTLPLANGTVLTDRLGGGTTSVQAGKVQITLSARGAAYFSP